MKKIILTGCFAIVFAVVAKDVQSECSSANAYCRLWNVEVQAQIDERTEKHRKADGEFVVSAPDGEGQGRQGVIPRLQRALSSFVEKYGRQGAICLCRTVKSETLKRVSHRFFRRSTLSFPDLRLFRLDLE